MDRNPRYYQKPQRKDYKWIPNPDPLKRKMWIGYKRTKFLFEIHAENIKLKKDIYKITKNHPDPDIQSIGYYVIHNWKDRYGKYILRERQKNEEEARRNKEESGD